MPASKKDAGLGRRAVFPSLAAAFLLLAAAGLLAVPAQGADDSNAGQLTPAPTVTPQELNSALSTLSQGTNDTQLQQLISQFQSQMNNGDYQGAASTLIQLRGLSSGGQNGASPSLNALLQSLSVGSNGASINSNTLASILNANPGAYKGSPQRLSLDMQTLAKLMQYANATLASQLLQNGFPAANGLGGGGSPSPIALPGVSGLPGLSIPSVAPPSLSVGGRSGGLPAIPATAFAFPLLVAAAATILFLARGRVATLIGARSLPSLASLLGRRDEGEGDGGAIPTDPRKRIEFYFGRAVRLMAWRGVPKLSSETHREFSSKCEATTERPQVSTISTLYEKAKFSGQSVAGPEADTAASAFLAMGRDDR